jgi:scyllo-inositol 2-dehydrogenase (NADP+)
VSGTTLRVGIAGYGLSGRHFHAPLLKGCGFDIAGVLTTDPVRAAQAQSDFSRVKIASTIEELVAMPLDLLVVASANLVHAEQAIYGIRAHIPVVIEKPMGRTLAETESIISLADKLQVPVTPFFNRLWDSDSLTTKRVLSEGLLGEVFRHDSRFERFRPTFSISSWREKYSADDGGGLLLDLQSHLISLSLDCFGSAKVVYSSVRSIRGGADDDVVVGLKHASGVDSYLSASAIIGAPGPRLRISGTKGSLVITDLDPQEALLRDGKYPAGGRWEQPTISRAYLHRGDEVSEVVAENGNYAAFYQMVSGALAGNNPWPVSTAFALEVAGLVDDARRLSIH